MFALVFFGAGGSSAATDPGLIEARRALVEVLLAAPGSSSAEWTKKYDATIGAAERRLQLPAPSVPSRSGARKSSGAGVAPRGMVIRRDESGRYAAAPLAGAGTGADDAAPASPTVPGVPGPNPRVRASSPAKETSQGSVKSDPSPLIYTGPKILDFSGLSEIAPSPSPGSP